MRAGLIGLALVLWTSLATAVGRPESNPAFDPCGKAKLCGQLSQNGTLFWVRLQPIATFRSPEERAEEGEALAALLDSHSGRAFVLFLRPTASLDQYVRDWDLGVRLRGGTVLWARWVRLPQNGPAEEVRSPQQVFNGNDQVTPSQGSWLAVLLFPPFDETEVETLVFREAR